MDKTVTFNQQGAGAGLQGMRAKHGRNKWVMVI